MQGITRSRHILTMIILLLTYLNLIMIKFYILIKEKLYNKFEIVQKIFCES